MYLSIDYVHCKKNVSSTKAEGNTGLGLKSWMFRRQLDDMIIK